MTISEREIIKKELLKPCWSCGKPGHKKEIKGSFNSTDSGNLIDVRATCSNKDCEFSNFVFSIKAWNIRKVDAHRIECPFCKGNHSAMFLCKTCGNKQEVIAVEVGKGIISLIEVS